ncbi:MAG: response regulator [Chloroflexaceae bacterium]|nr:response regulator [Chloroflexaceae bacterium]
MNTINTDQHATVLVIDDNRQHLRMLDGILREHGYQVRLAPDGKLGLRSAQAETPDVILLDISMPDMNGYEVCKKLKEHENTRDIPIIFISATHEIGGMVEAFQAGGADYITKPFRVDEVLIRVQNHLAIQQSRAALQQSEQALQQANRGLQEQIEQHQQTQATLQRVERTLRALSQCNTSLLRATSEADLLQTICQTIVDEGSYCLVWVSFPQSLGDNTVQPVAIAGHDPVLIEHLRTTGQINQIGPEPAQTALRTGEPSVLRLSAARAVESPCTGSSNHKPAVCIGLPLRHQTTVLGALCVCTFDVTAFDPEEMNLLGQLADNLAYGINTLRDRVAREQVEAALHENRVLLQSILDHAPVAIFVKDVQGRYLLTNRSVQTILQRSDEHIIGKTDMELFQLDQPPSWEVHIQQVFQHGQVLDTETELILNQQAHTFLTNLFPVPNAQGQIYAVGGISSDITHRKQVEEEMQRRNQELTIINRITEAINLNLALPHVLTTLQELLNDHLHIRAGAMYLYHEDDGYLSRETAWGIECLNGAALARLPVATAHNRQVVQQQSTMLLLHLTPETFDLPCFAPDELTGQWNYLGVPILAQGTLQGVLDLFSLNPESFTFDQITFFSTLGQQVGTAFQNARLFAEVTSARERLQSLSQRLIEVQEAERRYIASELHDEIAQTLTGLNLTLELVQRLPTEQARSRLEQAHLLVKELMMRIREMSLELRPPMLDDLGLLATVLWHIERYREQTDIEVVLHHHGLERRFVPTIEMATYRILQEALATIARQEHNNAVIVRLWANQEVLGLQVEDHGGSYNEPINVNPASNGLAGIYERVNLLSGTILIDTASVHGCFLSVELPLK